MPYEEGWGGRGGAVIFADFLFIVVSSSSALSFYVHKNIVCVYAVSTPTFLCEQSTDIIKYTNGWYEGLVC